jgi:hypothetical protein
MSVGRADSQSTSGGKEEVPTNVLASDEALVLLAWHDEESVSTKVVPLRLQQVGRDDLAPVPVEEG